jgi:hypothetical protein
MHTTLGIASIASCALLLFPMPAARSTPARSDLEACSLLTAADASAALGATSGPGKRLMPQDPTGCIWSDDPAASDSSRRVAVNTHSLRSFQIAKNSTFTAIKIEPVAGIGDEAFYQLYPNASPFIWFTKGNVAISIRILIGTKPSPFTVEQEKAKLAVLAKSVLAKL